METLLDDSMDVLTCPIDLDEIKTKKISDKLEMKFLFILALIWHPITLIP
jgi:hypothetical protein